MSKSRVVTRVIFCTGLALLLAACGGGGGGGGGDGTGTARATILFSADAGTRSADAVVVRGQGGGPVPVEDIESLFVTVTEVELQRCNGDDNNAGDLETVLVRDNEFDPQSVSIAQGGTVRWVWTEDTFHTITSGLIGDLNAGSDFDESADQAGDVIEIVFEDIGDYSYFSDTEEDIDDGMSGVVHVEDAENMGGGTGEGDGGHETVFEGSVDVNVLDLTELSEVLSSVDIPAGEYCRVVIRIANPRLVLKSDPNTVITNVHLTANGRLFIKDHFTLNEGDEVLIIVCFGSIHLVEAGNSGKYVLTPQLRADVHLVEANVQIEGTVESVNDDASIFTVRTENDEVFEVFADGETVIHTDDDADDPIGGIDVPLAFTDLDVGQQVRVEGLLTVGGQIEANDVTVADGSINTAI